MVVHGGTDRADDLARRFLAMHAQHRLEEVLRGVGRAFVIAIDA